MASGRSHQHGALTPAVVQREDRQADQPQDISGLEDSSIPASQLELDLATLDLDERVPPFTLVEDSLATGRKDDDTDGERLPPSPAEDTQSPSIRVLACHVDWAAGSVGGKPNAGNRSGPKVVISTKTECSMLNTSMVNARYSDSPQART